MTGPSISNPKSNASFNLSFKSISKRLMSLRLSWIESMASMMFSTTFFELLPNKSRALLFTKGSFLYRTPSGSMALVKADLIPSKSASSEIFFRSCNADNPAPSKFNVSEIMLKNWTAVSLSDFNGLSPGRLNEPKMRTRLPSTKPANAPCSWNGRLTS